MRFALAMLAALQYLVPPAISRRLVPNLEVRMAKARPPLDELHCF